MCFKIVAFLAFCHVASISTLLNATIGESQQYINPSVTTSRLLSADSKIQIKFNDSSQGSLILLDTDIPRNIEARQTSLVQFESVYYQSHVIYNLIKDAIDVSYPNITINFKVQNHNDASIFRGIEQAAVFWKLLKDLDKNRNNNGNTC